MIRNSLFNIRYSFEPCWFVKLALMGGDKVLPPVPAHNYYHVPNNYMLYPFAASIAIIIPYILLKFFSEIQAIVNDKTILPFRPSDILCPIKFSRSPIVQWRAEHRG